MTTVAATPASFRPPALFDNAAEWLRALGGVPLERIIFDPWPGTATEADLLRLVECDKRLCELIDGTLVEKPVGFGESLIAMKLVGRLLAHAGTANSGIVSGPDGPIRLSRGRVRMPDVGYFTLARLPGGTEPGEPIPSVAPDIAVEVLSARNTPAEMAQKLREYFDSGTRLAWIIDPVARTVAVYRSAGQPTYILDQSARLDGEDVLPGFKMLVADLFSKPRSA